MSEPTGAIIRLIAPGAINRAAFWRHPNRGFMLAGAGRMAKRPAWAPPASRGEP
jgi:hypothetical protein